MRASHAADRHRHRRRRACGLDRRRHAGARRLRRRPGRSARRLSAGSALREARRAAGPRPAPHRPRRRGAAAPGRFDGECWVARFGRVVEKRPGDQYGILYDTLVNTVRAAIPAARRIHLRQGHRDREQPRPADGHAVDRRGDLRAPGRGRERPQYRPAPRARHDARDREPVPFDHHRLRSEAGRAQAASISRR